jgi:ABC-type polysaccharide/polyol phosphate export permease
MPARRLPIPFVDGGRPRADGGPGLIQRLTASDLLPRFNLVDQILVIRALILRHLRLKYQDTRIGFWMEFLRPIIVILVHDYVFIALGRYMPGKIPDELFLIGGFTTWFAFSHSAIGTIYSRGAATAALIPNVTVMHFRIASIVWEWVAMLFLGFVGVALTKAIGRDISLPNIPKMAFVLAVACLFGFGYRLVFDALSHSWPIFKGIRKIILWLMFLTGGVYFSAVDVERPLAPFAFYDPLLNYIESMRSALYAGYPTAEISMLYATVCAVAITLLGLMMIRCIPRWTGD